MSLWASRGAILGATLNACVRWVEAANSAEFPWWKLRLANFDCKITELLISGRQSLYTIIIWVYFIFMIKFLLSKCKPLLPTVRWSSSWISIWTLASTCASSKMPLYYPVACLPYSTSRRCSRKPRRQDWIAAGAFCSTGPWSRIWGESEAHRPGSCPSPEPPTLSFDVGTW